MPDRPIACDTTVLLYLGRIGLAHLVSALFTPVYVPEAVMLELDMGRFLRRDTINPRELSWVTPAPVSLETIDDLPPNRLGAGERAVIACAYAHHGCVAGLDDLQARGLAEALELEVTGTLGVLLCAKQAGLIPTVRVPLDAAVAQGFRLAPDLYQQVLRLANELQPGNL